MALEVQDRGLSRGYFEALTTPISSAAINYFNFRRGFSEYLFQPVNATGGFFIHVWLTPRITGMWKYTAATTTYTDMLEGGTLVDRSIATTVALNSFDADDAIYIVTSDVVGGFFIDLTNANANASVVTFTYSDSATTLTGALTETDGTDSGGATLAVDGRITWTAPTDQVQARGNDLGLPAGTPQKPTLPGYWYKMTVSLDLDSAVSLAQVVAIPKDAAAYTRLRANTVANMVEYSVPVNQQACGGIGIRGSETTDTYALNANYLKRGTTP